MKFKSFGAPAMRDCQGNDVAFKSAKAIALVALLLDAGGHRRSRRWIEGMLWPDSPPARASGSLRQVLALIRQKIGADYIETNRSTIRLLDVVPDVEANEDARRRGQDFLEGLDVDGSDFNEWLASRRANQEANPAVASVVASSEPRVAAPARLPVYIYSDTRQASDTSRFVCNALTDAIGDLMSDFGEVEIYQRQHITAVSEQMNVAVPDRGLDLSVEILTDGDSVSARLALNAPMSGRTYWTHRARTKAATSIDDTWFRELVFRSVEASYRVAAKLPQNPATAEGYAAQGMRSLFRFDADGYEQAERFFDLALQHHDMPSFHSWKAMLHQMQGVERVDQNWAQKVEQAKFHMSKASLSAEPSSMICALLAQCQVMLCNDVEMGELYARDALRLNPNNAFAYSAICCTELRRGNPQEALIAARYGEKLAAATAYAPWWHLLAGLAAMAMEDFEESIYHYRKAAMHAPSFRAPMRNLFVLYKATGQEQEAERYLNRLIQQEPDFSLHRLKTDPDYPAGTIRSTSLINMI